MRTKLAFTFALFALAASAQTTEKKQSKIVFSDIELSAGLDYHPNFPHGNFLSDYGWYEYGFELLKKLPAGTIFRQEFPDNYLLQSDNYFHQDYYSDFNKPKYSPTGSSYYINSLLAFRKKDGTINKKHKVKVGLGYSYRNPGEVRFEKLIVHKSDTVGEITFYGYNTNYIIEDSCSYTIGIVDLLYNSGFVNLSYYYCVGEGDKVGAQFGIGTDIGYSQAKGSLQTRYRLAYRDYYYSPSYASLYVHPLDGVTENITIGGFFFRPTINLKINYRLGTKSNFGKKAYLFYETRLGREYNSSLPRLNANKTFFSLNLGIRYALK